MSSRKRPAVPAAVETAVITMSRRRCCFCVGILFDYRPKPGQIAHLDGNPSDSRQSNLAWMCFEHHDRYDGRTSQSKNLTKAEAVRYRTEVCRWVEGKLGLQRSAATMQRIDIRGATPISISCVDRFTSDESSREWQRQWEGHRIEVPGLGSVFPAEWQNLKSPHDVTVLHFDDTTPECASFNVQLTSSTRVLVVREHHSSFSRIRGDAYTSNGTVSRSLWYRALRDEGYTPWCGRDDAAVLSSIHVERSSPLWNWVETRIRVSSLRVLGRRVASGEEMDFLLVRTAMDDSLMGDWCLRAIEVRQE